jgi:hypothetical protein
MELYIVDQNGRLEYILHQGVNSTLLSLNCLGGEGRNQELKEMFIR